MSNYSMETVQSSVSHGTLLISFNTFYLHAASAALIAYEYAITVNLEVNLFWRRRVTMTSILFGANRYLPPIVVVLTALYPIQLFTLMGAECSALRYSMFIVSSLQYYPWAVFAALRTYILSSKSWALALLVFLLHIVAPISYFIMKIHLRNYTVFSKFGHCEIVPIQSFPTENLIILEPISAIIFSRFLIDLQEASISSTFQETVSGGSMTSMAFRVDGFIGSVGSSLPAPGRLAAASWISQHGRSEPSD
ncbi:hypothetical protein C8Q76DRAFT_793679 [Earliella scabrosa]|nr:hypothetical protein C8Q76DRAFT_793679 [Earliella scabrosa]